MSLPKPDPLSTPTPASSSIGRYVLHRAIARGGMATVHAARLVAGGGVSRLVAAKRLHPHFTDDPEFVAMFHDEARIASLIHHPNVVPVLDVIHEGEELILVQEYVHGCPLSHLFKLAHQQNDPIPIAIGASIISGVLAGLEAAHEATDECGDPLGVVHRDVSPQNVLVSVDGIPRLVDFGIAKAKSSVHHTREGFFKGKLGYMSPEQLRAEPVTRRVDIYAAGVLLWEMVVNRRFYDGKNDADFVRSVALGSTPTPIEALAAERDSIAIERWAEIERLDPIVSRALAVDPDDRFQSAAEMATEIIAAVRTAPSSEVARFVRTVGADYLEKRQQMLLAPAASATSSSHEPIALSSDDHSHSGRSSGARMRLAHANENSLGERLTEPAPHEIDLITTRAMSSSSSSSSSPPNPNAEERRVLVVPWTIVAALFAIVALLGGMLFIAVRDSSSTTPAGPSASASSIPSAEVTRPLPVVTSEEPTTTTPATRAPPVVTIVRYAPAPQPKTPPPSRAAAPIPTPTPPASMRADCNPPFYFDGTKKVFKPSCL